MEVGWWLITNYGPSGEIGPARSGSQQHNGIHPDESVCVLNLSLIWLEFMKCLHELKLKNVYRWCS